MKQTEEELVRFLKKEDTNSFTDRLQRLRFLVEMFGEPGHLLLPGELSPYLFEEARLCYLNGEYIACVMLCQSLLEELFRGLFRMSGRDDLNKAGFKEITDEALSKGLITQDEARAFDRIRDHRNRYVHPPPPSSPKRMPRRMVEENKDLFKLMRSDAEKALITTFRIIKHHPFYFPDEGGAEK